LINKKVIVIGAGFAGLSAASLVAKNGYEVHLFEKNNIPGGRAAFWQKEGFTFDMGPSWYWMPEVFEDYFALFNKKVSDYYSLSRLNPSYRMYFAENDFIDIPASLNELEALFESIEPGSSKKLKEFLKLAEYKYNTGMKEYVIKPSLSVTEYFDFSLLKETFRIQLLQSLKNHIRKYFTHPKLIRILEFPVLFLGSTPAQSPALYSMMNYADLVLGTWYPEGGIYKVVEAMYKIALENGVQFHFNMPVKSINTKNGKAVSVSAGSEEFFADAVISGSDYHHTETKLLHSADRSYSDKYWESRIMSPSSLLFYVALDGKVQNIRHHSLFFDESFDDHASQIYGNPQWPERPLFYLSAPTQTDSTIAPAGKEILTFLIPLASGLKDSAELHEKYFRIICKRFYKLTGNDISGKILFKRSFCLEDFTNNYNSFKGNAYGLANTLSQTAIFKPKMKSKKVENLFYAGQLTVPGPGVPPAIISGQIAASETGRYLKNHL